MRNYFNTISTPLLSVDFDYFRVPRERWELMIVRLKQMGANAITITMPWGFHEFQRGQIDLTGGTNPRRNVTDLLGFLVALGFHCILKPGPYANSGVLGDGIPLWLMRKGDNFEVDLLQEVEHWYKGLSKTLIGHQWPDGPVIAIHIRTEPGQPLPSHGKQLTEVKWRIWLRKHYDGIEALNEAYGSDYRTVNDVKFPQTWSQEKTSVEIDAAEFLAKVRSDTQSQYTQILADAGWDIPIYPGATEIYAHLPTIQTCSLLDLDKLPALEPDNRIISFQHPIRVDPDLADVGQEAVWAKDAPIRIDGSLRRKFWTVRSYLWQHLLPNVNTRGKTLRASFDHGKLVTCSSDASVKLEVAAATKPIVYRLRFDGKLLVDSGLKVAPGKISGSYLAEDEVDQTDLLLILGEPAGPLSDFPLAYLRNLLVAQAQTLVRCAGLAEKLGQTLAPPPAALDTDTPKPPTQTLHSLEEARRGLSEADAALRKAIVSISELESGFATILGKGSTEAVLPSGPTAAVIRTELFEGSAKEILIETGAVCTDIAPELRSAAATVQKIIDTPGGFNVEQYQRGFVSASTAAQAAYRALQEVVSRLRQEIARGKLPLLVWRIHDQVLEIGESLRWGVLRGK